MKSVVIYKKEFRSFARCAARTPEMYSQITAHFEAYMDYVHDEYTTRGWSVSWDTSSQFFQKAFYVQDCLNDVFVQDSLQIKSFFEWIKSI